MADADSYIKSQRVYSEVHPPIPQHQANWSKYYSHFLFKSLLVAVFLVIIPLFPSQAPDFVNKTIPTKSWELLHLLFVGIAVSYGLCSRRNVETEKEIHLKIDSAQSYLSRFLQVSSVFDDELESPSGSDENKIQTWNSRYFRGEPVVVVSQENSVLDKQGNTSFDISNKPLLLPVRSLRSQVSNADVNESVKEHGRSPGSINRSGSSLKGSYNGSKKIRNREIRGLDPLELKEKLKETVVLPSPIPWRSRSGRMEINEEVGGVTPPSYSPPPSMEESEFDRLNSRPESTSPSPKKLSPAASLSPELRAKNVEDLARKKSFNKSSSPPAAPPPSSIDRKSSSIKLNSGPKRSGISFEKEMKKSLDELKDMNRNRRNSGLESLKPESKSTHMEGSSMEKSVRTIRPSEPVADVRKPREIKSNLMEERNGRRSKAIEPKMLERTGRKMEGFDQPLKVKGKTSFESSHSTRKPVMSKYQQEEKKEFVEDVIVVSEEEEEDTDSEADGNEGNSENEKTPSNTVGDPGADPNEVDKKADEFIAKFREQIRLQRIASIKRSSGKRSSRDSLK